MLKYLKLPLTFDHAAMQREAFAFAADGWSLHYNTRDYDGEWNALPLRSAGGDSGHVLALPGTSVEYADTPFMERCPYIRSVVESFNCPKLSVRLLRLKPGATVHTHTDGGLTYEEGEARIHVPIATNEGVEFYLDEERIIMNEGECWYMNFALPHRLANHGTTDRIHLVIDCTTNVWLRELFADPRVEIKQEVADVIRREDDPEVRKKIIAQLREMGTEAGDKLAQELEEKLSAHQS